MEIYLIIWLLCGAIAAYLYKQKGRSVGLGFVGGVLLGPLGLLLVLISGDTLVKCPYCAEKIQPIAKVCKHCGKDLPADWTENLPKKNQWIGPVVFLVLLLVVLFVLFLIVVGRLF